MNRTRFLMLSAASVIGLTVVATAPLSAQNAMPAPEGAWQIRMVDSDEDGRRGGWGHGWRHGRHGRGHQMICSDVRDDKIDQAVEFVESFVDFTPPQAEAWAKLTTAVRSGSARVGQACQDETLTKRPESSAAKLGRAEKLLTIGLDIIKEVRPAYDEFYATLDDRQKKAVDQMFRRYRRI
jgi:hypothetical protein